MVHGINNNSYWYSLFNPFLSFKSLQFCKDFNWPITHKIQKVMVRETK